MLATKLSRAQLDLQAHRIWLRRFSLGSNARLSFSTTATAQKGRPAANVSSPPGGFTITRTSVTSKSQKPFAHRKKDAEYEKIAAQQIQIRDLSKEFDFDSAMEIYRSIEDKKIIVSPVMLTLAQSMAYWSRMQMNMSEDKLEPEKSEKLQQYAEELAQDMMKGALRPKPDMSAHILSLFIATRTWDAATKFWDWLRAQGDEHINDHVYGSAILLQAAQDAKLEDLEALYQEGMTRLPVGFSAYHFSPGAIVPDRERSTVVGPPYPPATLLHAIMAARLMRGDAQNAYHVLDSFLRLKPVGVEGRFYTEYQRERPVAEAYTVFAIACKSGTVLPANSYRALLSALRSNADTRDVRKFALTVRAMISATYLQIGAGGRLTKNAATELIIVLSSILRVKGVYSMETRDRIRLVEAVQELINKTLELAARFSASPTIAAYNSIITNLGGAGQAEATITAAIRGARDNGLDPTIVTRRSIIVAAGTAGDKELVMKAWKWLVDARARDGQLPDTTDLHILTKAAVQTDNASFVTNDVVANMTHLESWQRDNLLERIEKRIDAVEKKGKPADIEELLKEVAKIKADLEVFDTRTSDAKGVQDFSQQAVPMLVFSPPRDVRLPEAEMRELYDQLTTDPDAPENPELKASPVSVTNGTRVPFAQLRYESWKLITYLLAEADRHDKAYISAVDAAIAAGEKPPQRNYGELFEDGEQITGVGLSDPVQTLEFSESDLDIDRARARICELRKVDVPKERAQGQL
jgi:hypothetical protein